MHIARIVVRNFRNLQQLDLSLSSGVTCVIGENNSGKTNLAHAIRLPLDVTLSSRHRQLSENDVFSGVDISTPQQVLVSLEFTGFSEHESQEALVGGWGIGTDKARLTYRFRPRPDVLKEIDSEERPLTIDDYHWQITGGGGDTDPATCAYSDDLGKSVRFSDLQYFLVVFLPALRDVQHDLMQSRSSPLSRLFSSVDIPPDDKDALVDILRTANERIASSDAISETGSAISEAFADAVGEASAMQVRLGLSDPSFASIARSLRLLLSDGSVRDFDTFRNGLGLNNVLYVSMLLEYFDRRMAEDRTAGQLLMLEEPEAHLHPQLQRVLFQALESRGCQVLLTTHSTHVTSQSPIASYITLTRTPDGVIPANVASASGLTSPEQQDLDRYLDATRSTLLYARKVMLVEGPAEAFLIPPLIKAVKGIDLDRQGISVVPIHGVHFGAYTKLFSASALPKKCAVVADKDTEGPTEVNEADTEGNTQEEAEGIDAAVPERLESLESDFVRVFACDYTFERALAVPGMLMPVAEAARDLGATRTAAWFDKANNEIEECLVEGEQREQLLDALGKRILSTAKRFGKARFAQIVARHVEKADCLPQYIDDAVKWLME